MNVADKAEMSRNELLVPQEVVYDHAEQFENDGYVDDTHVITRIVTGKLAEDVRKRVGAPDDATVSVTEEEFDGWISDVTAEHTWTTVIECNGVIKDFEGHNAAVNFGRLLAWLEETPSKA